MKNNKIFRTVLAVLSLAILFGAAVATVSNAESAEGEVSILAQNIVYTDRVAIAYAVDATIDDAVAGTVKVAYYWEDEGATVVKSATLLNPEVEGNVYTKNDVDYPVFVTEGVPAKDLLRVAFAVAYTGDVASSFSFDYSVAEYLYTKLYRDDFVNKTESDGKDFERKKLYENLLTYGAQAQVVLENYGKLEEEQEPLVTSSSYVTSGADVTIDLDNFVFIPAGREVTVEPEYTGTEEIKGWLFTDFSGNISRFTDSITVSVGGKVTAEYVPEGDVSHVQTFDGDRIDSTADFGISMILSSASTATVENVSDPQTYVSAVQTRPEDYGYGAFLSLATDPKDSANRVLSIQSTSIGGGSSYAPVAIKMNTHVDSESGDVFVFETDLFIGESSTGQNMATVEIYDADGNKKSITLAYVSSATNTDGTANQLKTAGASISAYTNQWIKFSLVVDNATSKSYVYYSVDGGSTYATASAGSSISGVDIANISYAKFNVASYKMTYQAYVDNMQFVKYDTFSLSLTDGSEASFGTHAN